MSLVIKRTLKGVHWYCDADYDNKEAIIEVAQSSQEKKETIIHELLHCLSSWLLEEANLLATTNKQKRKLEKLEEELVIRLEQILTKLL